MYIAAVATGDCSHRTTPHLVLVNVRQGDYVRPRSTEGYEVVLELHAVRVGCDEGLAAAVGDERFEYEVDQDGAVSYTHLTLPTNREV